MPQVFRLPVRRAQATIENAGLRLGEIASEYSRNVPEGLVTSTEPAAGARVPKGTAVTLTVSMGPSGIAEMPLLKGMLLNRAKDIILNNGLVLAGVTEVVSPLPPGTVVEQEPVERAEIRSGDSVKLRIAKGTQSRVGAEGPKPSESKTIKSSPANPSKSPGDTQKKSNRTKPSTPGAEPPTGRTGKK